MSAPELKSFQITPVFHVTDLTAAIRFYSDVFGFAEVFSWGRPPFYAGIRLADVTIHLNSAASAADRRGKGSAYVFVAHGLEDYHNHVMARGAILVGDPPKRYDYGLKDVKYADPDGNWLSFGET